MAKPKICGARTKSKAGKCQRVAGWGTDHLGAGKCKLHGGASKGAPKGSQNALKHGVYSKLFTEAEMDAAKAMQGSVDSELAIARLQFARLIHQMQQQGDAPMLDVVEDKTIAAPTESADDVKERRAKDAQKCGEHYDPDDDDDLPTSTDIESAPLERKRIYKRRDWSVEFTRLTALIARLEAQSLSMINKKAEMERLSKANQGGAADVEQLTDTELDSEILQLTER
jgi:hypothetical protein